ncbi:MAG: DUF6603 domain-containing protein [Lysobacteraceae bacterium]
MSDSLDKALLAALGDLFSPLIGTEATPGDPRRLLIALGWNADAMTGLDIAALGDTVVAIRQALGRTGADALSVLLDAREPIVRLIQSLATWTPPAGLPADIAETLALDLVHALVDAWLVRRAPAARAALVLTGLLETAAFAQIARGDGTVIRRAATRPRLRPDRLAEVMRSPLGFYDDLARPSGVARTTEALSDLLLPLVRDLLLDLDIPASYGDYTPIGTAPPSSNQLAAAQRLLVMALWMPDGVEDGQVMQSLRRIVLGLVPNAAGTAPGLLLATTGALAFNVQRPQWRANFTADGMPRAVVISSTGFERADPTDTTSVPRITAGFAAPGSDPALPAFRIGAEDGFRIQATTLQVDADLQLAPNTDFGFRVAVTGLGMRTSAAGRDSFLSSLLSAEDSDGLDLALTYSLRDGVSVQGRVEFARRWAQVVSTPVLGVGPLVAGLAVGNQGLVARVEATLDTHLGPLSITVEDLGLRFSLSPGGNEPGAAGLMPALRLSGPKGVGLSLDAGPVKGGGYLFFDPDQALYAGAVQLSMKALAFNAVGVVTTRLPDGGDGFSMLVIITAEFPPIQLGFGFTLNGLGGLAGIHRAMDQDALSACLREGRLDSILFPRDVVANVRRIVDDIRTVFPPQRDRHVFGPMVKIGWGANALLEMDVAVLISLPAPIVIAILGRMRAALPTKDNAVVDLRLAVLGLIDLGRGRITVEARLVDSRIAAFAVTGGMALLISWGATKAFVLSVGGFHPRFLPPPDFHAPARLAIALSSGENPTFALSSYFAITSNAVQFGAGADFRLAADTALGLFELLAYARFDVLLVFDPPFFAADLVAGIEVKRNGATLFLAKLEASLTGPEPWRIAGLVEIQIVVPVRIPFQHTLGGATAQTPAAMRPLDELRRQLAAEIARAENWAALPTADADAVVVLRKVEAVPGTVLVHPLGGLGFRQRTLPLGKVLRRFGTATVSDPGAFAIAGLALGGTAVGSRGVDDDFAPGEFEPLSDDEKLARPAFETLPAGVEATPAGPWLPRSLRAPVTPGFEETVVAPNGGTTGGASTQPGLGFVQPDPRRFGDAGAAAIRVRPERWVLADPDTLQTPPGGEAAHAVLADAQRGRADARVRVQAHDAIVVVDP